MLVALALVCACQITDGEEPSESSPGSGTTAAPLPPDTTGFFENTTGEPPSPDSGSTSEPGTTAAPQTTGEPSETEGLETGDQPQEETPIHFYIPRDDIPFVYGYRLDLEEQLFEEMTGSPFELPEPAGAVASTYGGGGVFFGGASLMPTARDPQTGALTKVGGPIPQDNMIGVIGVARDDSRIFVAGTFAMTSTDVTMYGIEPDFGLVEGATFTVGAFPRRMKTDALGQTLFAPFDEDGLFVGTLGAYDEAPTPATTTGEYGPSNEVAVTSDGSCLYMQREPAGLLGVGLRAFAVGEDLDPVQVDQYDEGYVGRVYMAPDDQHVLTAIGGSLESLPINDDCTFGEPVGAVQEWPVPTRYSNLMPYGDGALVLRFDSNTRAEPIVVGADGTLELGTELEIIDNAFVMAVMAEDEA